ncbi:MAG: hypothetical protein AB7O97_10710 [Planctomycetota bacterium]
MRILLSFGLAALLPAQQQATTLALLSQQAAVVAVARATAATDPSPEWHRVEFRTVEVLRGAVDESFALLEPAGRCCGRALFAVEPGQELLLFLDRRGAALHPRAGDRGVLPAEPAVLAHVRDLLAAAGDDAATAGALTAGLSSPTLRVRLDAALTLPALPRLVADATGRDRVFAALRACAQVPDTALPALAAAAVRLDGARAALELLPPYLGATDPGVVRALGAALTSLPAHALGTALAAAPLSTPDQQVRAAELLAAVPDATHVARLDRMLASAPTPRVTLAVTEALLAHGARPESLALRVPAVVLDLARERRAALPRFRAVRPGDTR